MAEENRNLAKQTYDTLCAALDGENWKYRRDDDNFVVEYSVGGEDLPMGFTCRVDAEHQLVRLLSPMPLTVKEEQRLDVAVAVSLINDKLVNGCFDFNLLNGELCFRMCNSFCDSVLGAEVFLYMLAVSIHTVEQFNDKLFMLATGAVTIEKFVDLLSEIVD